VSMRSEVSAYYPGSIYDSALGTSTLRARRSFLAANTKDGAKVVTLSQREGPPPTIHYPTTTTYRNQHDNSVVLNQLNNINQQPTQAQYHSSVMSSPKGPNQWQDPPKQYKSILKKNLDFDKLMKNLGDQKERLEGILNKIND